MSLDGLEAELNALSKGGQGEAQSEGDSVALGGGLAGPPLNLLSPKDIGLSSVINSANAANTYNLTAAPVATPSDAASGLEDKTEDGENTNFGKTKK